MIFTFLRFWLMLKLQNILDVFIDITAIEVTLQNPRQRQMKFGQAKV